MTLEDVVMILKSVLPDKVFYGSNVYDNEDNASMPYIVYQEISKRAIDYIDDIPIAYRTNIQITLVTKRKDTSIEVLLENKLLENDLTYSLASEFFNSDKSINSVYQIIMEDL